ALAQIVGDDPQIEAVGDGRVAADAADINRILAGRLRWRHVALVGAVIDDDNPGGRAQRGARAVLRQRPLELDINRLGVPYKDRHADAGGRHRYVRVEDFAGL